MEQETNLLQLLLRLLAVKIVDRLESDQQRKSADAQSTETTNRRVRGPS